MLGHAVFRVMAKTHDVVATARSGSARSLLPDALADRIRVGVDVTDSDSLVKAFAAARPEAVVNCVGVVKQLSGAKDPLTSLTINSLLPHRLAALCDLAGARLIHVSTDCVFSGQQGMYREADTPDATDLYGRSKLLGEVDSSPSAVTLRTSIIGHELAGAHGLLGWFLAQRGGVKGFTRAVFSGLPTDELARVMCDVVLPRPELSGLFHVAADPISKFDLLCLINDAYGRGLPIEPSAELVIDRSLDGSRFRELTGYRAAPWSQLVGQMHGFAVEHGFWRP
jgi:dTDP-4-dehydrorhamnose reductase